MDLWRATIEAANYEPYTDEFDRIADVSEIVDKARALEIVTFLTDYRIGKFERPEYPTDHDELLITIQHEKNESDLVAAIPRPNSRKHLYDFIAASKDLTKRLHEDFCNLDINPEETSVTFLIESAGSTRGEIAYHTALSTVEMVKALDSLGVATGVIGYTTQSWKGGKSREKWISEGRPKNPGRLEDLLHIVFKRPDTPLTPVALGWLHLLADPKLKKENVSGEGLMWGAAAAAATSRLNKLLVHVIHKPETIADSSTSADPDAAEKFRRHQEAIIEEIDSSEEVAMSTLMLAPNSRMLKETQDRRNVLGKMFVVAEGDGRADEVLEGFVNGTVAAMERAATIRKVATPFR
jgi:cobalamin biosynthesis protein CobT